MGVDCRYPSPGTTIGLIKTTYLLSFQIIKTLLLTTITAAGIALLEIPPAQAQVRITFPVTSYCGGYGGPAEQFLIGLGGKLILTKQSIRLSPVMATTAQGSTGEAGGLLVGDHTAP